MRLLYSVRDPASVLHRAGSIAHAGPTGAGHHGGSTDARTPARRPAGPVASTGRRGRSPRCGRHRTDPPATSADQRGVRSSTPRLRSEPATTQRGSNRGIGGREEQRDDTSTGGGASTGTRLRERSARSSQSRSAPDRRVAPARPVGDAPGPVLRCVGAHGVLIGSSPCDGRAADPGGLGSLELATSRCKQLPPPTGPDHRPVSASGRSVARLALRLGRGRRRRAGRARHAGPQPGPCSSFSSAAAPGLEHARSRLAAGRRHRRPSGRNAARVRVAVVAPRVAVGPEGSGQCRRREVRLLAGELGAGARLQHELLAVHERGGDRRGSIGRRGLVAVQPDLGVARPSPCSRSAAPIEGEHETNDRADHERPDRQRRTRRSAR